MRRDGLLRVMLFGGALLSACVISSTALAFQFGSYVDDEDPFSQGTVIRSIPPTATAPNATNPAENSPANEEAQRKAQRQAKLQQVTFDRRPSAMLQAWVAPLTPPDQPEVAEPPAGTPAAKPTPPDPFDQELKDFQRAVTLGEWDTVKAFLAKLEKTDSIALYKRMLQTLRQPPAPGQLPPEIPPAIAQQLAQQLQQLREIQSRSQQGAEKPVLSFQDWLALAGCCPGPKDAAVLNSLGDLLRLPLDQGHAVGALKAMLEAEVAKPEAQALFTKRQAAKVLFAAGLDIHTEPFLPTLADAEKANDAEGLNLLSRLYLARHRDEKKVEYLEQAWLVTQAVLASRDLKKVEKDQALARAVDLAPKIKKELGQKWLDDSFAQRPERGMEILATIGAASAQAGQTQARDAAGRLRGLQLQTTAVEALLKAAPDQAQKWRDSLGLLANNWLREAVFSYRLDRSTSLGPRMQRDPFGNMFYIDESQMEMINSGGMPSEAIKVADLLDIRPSNEWLALAPDSLRPKFDMVFAQLYLKVNEEDKAFPYIERIAAQYPEVGRDLVNEYLRLWTQSHDPNAARSRTNVYMFMFGFERKAEGIPLTRSKQERNLHELSQLVPKLKAIAGDKLDQAQLAKAFTTCHSAAEVYRLDAIEQVFGPIAELKPKMLSELVQQMRGNLASLWRRPAVQEQGKTKRKQKDIEAEVMRGYEMARKVVGDALKSHPDEWTLELALAALDFDQTNYEKELKPNSNFSQHREQAFARFRRATELYAARVTTLAEDEQTTQPFEIWFYAGLGACDLGSVTEETVPDAKQVALIRAALDALPGAAAERHLGRFANSLFTRMSAVNPAVKFRYLKAGFEIVGDHKQANEARKVYDYYKDLVTEIKLETVVDGSMSVGHDEPFGILVNLRHTREIERESGGFGKYLQNQSNQMFAYNYGRPLANYRDKFEEVARKALQEQFEIQSITFQEPTVNSRATDEYGWRVTPYAYVLVKPRGPQVDKIPPLRLDLDFLDTSGYVVLPVESSPVPVDATAKAGPARPYRKLVLNQILDERQAEQGKLLLEVKATALGLVPRLDDIVDILPADFEVTGTEDQGVSVVRFDPEAADSVVQSERTWLVTLRGKDGLAEKPRTFRFATPKVEVNEVAYHRYVDADLQKVDEELVLEQKYGRPARIWPWVLAAVVAVSGVAGGVWWFWPRTTAQAQVARYQIPEDVNPFTVLGLLRDIERNNGLPEARRVALRDSITRVERIYFSEQASGSVDLRQLAEEWAAVHS